VLGADHAGPLAHAALVVSNIARLAPPPVAGVACLALTGGPVVRLCRVERTADSTVNTRHVPGVVLGGRGHAAPADPADALEVGVAHALGDRGAARLLRGGVGGADVARPVARGCFVAAHFTRHTHASDE